MHLIIINSFILIEYIKEHDKLLLTKNKKEKRINQWISNQQRNYVKKIYIMKNKEIYNKWSNFKEINKRLF